MLSPVPGRCVFSELSYSLSSCLSSRSPSFFSTDGRGRKFLASVGASTARRSAKKSHLGHIPLNSKAAQPPAQSSPNRALSNTRHARYPPTGFGGKRTPVGGEYLLCKTSYGKTCFFVIDDMIVIRCYKCKVFSSCYLSTHSFKVRWKCLAKKPKATCFHCFKDKSVNNCKQQKLQSKGYPSPLLQSLFSLFKSITYLFKTAGLVR
jgi:hypothetical protein